MEQSFTDRLLEHYKSKQVAPTEASHFETNDSQLWAYRQAAAVLHCFIPEKLVPASDVPRHDNPRILLFDDISYSPGRYSEGIFTLETNIRKKALKRFTSTNEMLDTLIKNPGHPETALQKMWKAYLQTCEFPPPDTLTYKELINLSQIISWLDGIDTDVPDLKYVQQLMRRKSVVANFEHLVTDNFTGRETELSLLKRHLAPSGGKSDKNMIHAVISNWLSPSTPNPILSIFGPGGIGKSALSGKLMLDNSRAEKAVQFPFAYLPFDLGNLRIESPFTILVEAASQFALQFPEYHAEIEEFNSKVRDFRDERSSLINRRKSSNTRGIILEQYHKEDDLLYKHFAMLMKTMSEDKLRTGGKTTPVLFVFDTFEEVEYRDFESLNAFWRMLYSLIEHCPALRVIITGRTSIAKLGVKSELLTELPLEELQLKDRSLLLERLGVDSKMANILAAQIGGNPLSLRLAANLIASDKNEADSKGIKDLTKRKWLLFYVDEQLIQGQLYQRILSHIHDENVKKLAHPGMVLRTVTPEIILKVLAPQCKIEINTIEQAESLFNDLRKEQAIVKSGNTGDLVYRPEIRESMIRLLMQDKYNETRMLRRAAIEYYAGKDDEASRAEEMYHRLALGEDEFWLLDSRWQSGIETSIASNLNEYSDKIKVWLASRINLEIPREIFQRADIADWERNILRKVKQALSEFQLEQALKLLNERDDRTESSPLFALEAKTHLLMDQYDEAVEILDDGIEKVAVSANRGRLAELFWLRSQVEILQNKILDAHDSLWQAASAVENAGNPIPYIHILCHLIALRQNYKQLTQETASLLLKLNNACERLDSTTTHNIGFVLNLAASLLGNEFPRTKEKLSNFANGDYFPTTDMLTMENLAGLDEYRESWEVDDDRSIKARV